jgi:hypothetical protein
MARILGAAGLFAISLFMLLGFLSSEAALGGPATIAALALTIALPAVGAGLLLRSHVGERARLRERKRLLREQTVNAELLRLAAEKGGRLTVLEVATELALSPDEAKAALDALMIGEHAEIEITDAGVIVYDFHEIRHLDGRASSRGLLDD